MQVHYDAFISYRHSPKDSAIAQQIHRQLERFRVPKAIQKATGKKRLQRIFRDKEELPLSVNLSDDIDEALRNSDHLIVICSPRTSESQWVQREIQLFLEYHSIDKILIVLAEGEPEAVVPPMLIEGREPLCCDFRMPKRKAKLIELPRLAAALLGCRYDDLRQRQRQYRTRRMAALFSAALAAALVLAVYFFHTARQIQENYEQALINQSRYLSSTSLELLDDGDRLTAIALALEALPSEDHPRPWIPEAEYALGCATNAYTSTPDVLPITSFVHNDTVRGFLLTQDGKQLVSWDTTNQLYVWDTQTYRLQHTLPHGFSLRDDPILMPNGRLLVWNVDSILCGSCEEPGVLWELTPGEYGYSFSSLLAVPNTELVLAGCGGNILLIHTQTGAVEDVIPLPGDISYLSDLLCVSPDGNYVVCLTYDYITGYQPYLLSLQDRLLRPADVGFYYLDSGYFSEDGRLYLSGMLEDQDSSFAMMDMVSLMPSVNDVVCLDPVSATTLWHTQASYYQVNYGGRLGPIDFVGAEGTATDAIYCCFSNICIVLDASTGQLLSRGETTSPILDVVNRGARLRFLLEDGSLGLFYPDSQNIGSISYFAENLTAGRIINDYSYYILPWMGSRILLYSGEVYDNNYTLVSGSEDLTGLSTVAMNDQIAVFSDYNNVLSGCDLENRSILWRTALPSTSPYDICIAGLAQEQLLILQNRMGYGETATAAKLLSIDLQSGALTERELPLSTSEAYAQYSVTNGVCTLWGDRFAYLVNGSTMEVNYETGQILNESADILMLLDPLTDQVREYSLPVKGVRYLLPDSKGETLLLGIPTEDTGMLCLLLDRESGEVTAIDTPIMLDTITKHAQAAWSPDGKLLAVPTEDDILLLKPDGTSAGSVACKGQQLFSLCFNPGGELLVLYTNATLTRYDTVGTVLSKTDLYHYINGMTASSAVEWHFGQQGCGINVDGLCTVLDPETWQSYAYVPNCLLYAPESDRFFVEPGTDDALDVACYDRYTTQELIAMAKQILGEGGLTEDQRARYGLN